MVRQAQGGSKALDEPDNPAPRWRLCRAFDGGDGGGGASRRLRCSRLELAGGRLR